MKRILLATLLVTVVGFTTTAQNVNIPDANFKAYLVGEASINTNMDTEIQVSEAAAFTGAITCASLNIADLTGIEAFTALTTLNCFNNNLISLDLSQNTTLTRLFCNSNNLGTLGINQNTALETLACGANNLNTLDVSQNNALISLRCASNNLNTLDVSQHTMLTQVRCENNQLTSLNVANGNNANVTDANFNASNNPNLTCITVDDVTYSTNNWTNIDAGASFSTDCPVYIPDANFKAYLVGEASINTNMDTEIQVAEATAFTGTINCASLSIVDLTGIEAFTGLTVLTCSNNQLTNLDVTQNTVLTELNCALNSLSTLNVTQNTALTLLSCQLNNLNELDVSQNTALTFLSYNNNNISTSDVSQNTALISLRCQINNLSTLDVSQNTALTSLICNNNQLTSLNVANGNNSNISTSSFNASNNPNLTCITVDDVTYSTTNWTNIDVTSNFTVNVEAGVNQTVCDGETVTLSGSGAATYVWNNSITDNTPFTPSLGTITYTVTGTDGNGCMSMDSVEVTFIPLPNVEAGTDTSVCAGDMITLSGSGANSYVWDNGVTNGVAFEATATTTYIVTGTNACGTGIDEVTVTLRPASECAVSIEEAIANDGVSIYPNPSNGTFTLKPDVNLFGETFIITNILGELVHKGIFNREITIIDLSSHKKGIYFISNTSANFKRKLLIQ